MYTVHQAKTNLSRLIADAQAGKEVVIARGKTPVVKLVAVGSSRKRRIPGKYKCRISIKPSFFNPMTDEELKDWGYE